ncbi:MAG: 4-hydroxy-tetrahydrodipicolinate reductase [Azospirillaceae bacterium]
MRIGITGAGGRMGRLLIGEVLDREGAELVGAVDRPESGVIGQDAGLIAGRDPCGVRVSEDPVVLFADADAVIDFTSPAATVEHAGLAAQGKTIHVIGTTGLDRADEEAVAIAARHTTIVLAPNMSLGVNLLFALTAKVAAALGPDYDIEILEMHHRLKRDAPSGTALGLGRAAAEGRGTTLDEAGVFARQGETGPRREGAIGFATLRGGDVVGDHTVIFAAEGERLELTHKASNRAIYARGAMRAAFWAHGQRPGLYTMADVLGL